MSLTKSNNYRATFILDTRGYEQPVETLIEKLSKLMQELGGDVKSTKDHGRRDFIRVTDVQHTGDRYVIFEVDGPPTMPAGLQDKLRLDKTVKRLLVETL